MKDYLNVSNLVVHLRDRHVVRNVSFKLGQGQIGCLLGPSGCGKTTTLRTIAGFEQPAEGEISLDGTLICDARSQKPPEARHVGMVFQDLALFPHLDVFGNVAFGIRQMEERDMKNRVNELLELVGMAEAGQRYPHELSGGQQQRIALIRAMAPRPRLLLLDEPFSSQDIELRNQLVSEVREILRIDNATALLVTHDQHEAFAFADVIGVMDAGNLAQWDSAYNLYHQPSTRFVADFIGHGVFVSGTVGRDSSIDSPLGTMTGDMDSAFSPGTRVDFLVRPDDVIHDDKSPHTGTVISKSFRGADFMYTLELNGSIRVLCLAPSHHDHAIGEKIGIRLEFDHLVAFPRE